MHNADIELNTLSKIEGHAGLEVKVRQGKVESAKLKVSEGKRFFEQACIGKGFKEIPMLSSRICGTCSAAHLLAAIEGVEKAFDFKPSQQTLLLRKLLLFGEMIRDHGMHLYYFCLPDLFGKDSILEFDGELHEWLHDSMQVRGAGTKLADWVGGRSIHPITPVIGGFSLIPKKEKIPELLKELKLGREKAVRLVKVFFKEAVNFERQSNHVALVNEDYSFLNGVIKSSSGKVIPEELYAQHLDEIVLPYTNSNEFLFEGKDFSVGALARMNLNRLALHKETIKQFSQELSVFPNNDSFTNTLAQAIEIVHCFDYSIELLESFSPVSEKPAVLQPIEARGIGCIEASRGTLYYSLNFDDKGFCTNAKIVIPTAQNLRSMENDIKEYLPSILHNKRSDIEFALEKLVRSYDPCMSCATHFLKVKWK
jgi:coenzyme F420-reducing hydrogenase alpha subunit